MKESQSKGRGCYLFLATFFTVTYLGGETEGTSQAAYDPDPPFPTLSEWTDEQTRLKT